MAKQGRRPRKNDYLTSDQIYEGWLEWKRTGVIPEYWAKHMMTLATHMLMMPQFNAYPRDMKEEMAQEACMKIIKSLHNMDGSRRSQFFSYWSCCCYSAFLNYLTKHYRRINRKRKIFYDALQYAKDNNLYNVRPDIVRSIEEQMDLYGEASSRAGGKDE